MTTEDVQTRFGTMRIIADDHWVSRSLRELGEYSQYELLYLQMLLGVQSHGRWDSVIVEAGAYLGDMTVPLSRLCRKLYAFEPQAEVRALLEWNLEVNGCDNVEVLPYALGHVNETTGYSRVDASPGSTQMGMINGEGEAEVRTLDSLGIECDLLKADVEGMEVPLLAGAQELLRRSRPILFLERDTVETPGQITVPEVLPDLGYLHYPLAFLMYNRDNWKGNKENNFGYTASFMSLGVPMEING